MSWRPSTRRDLRRLLWPVAAVVAFAGPISPAAATPLTCSIGELVPTDVDIGLAASWPRELMVDVPTTLTIEIDLGPGLAALPSLAGNVRDLVVRVRDPAIDFTGGEAELGRGSGSIRAQTTARGGEAEIIVAGPVVISRDQPMGALTAELDAVPRQAGRLEIDSGDLEIGFVLFADGIEGRFDTRCLADDPEPILVTTVGGAAVADPGEVYEDPAAAAVDQTPEELPNTGPGPMTWILIVGGLVVLDAGWAIWSAVARPASRRSRRRFLRWRTP